MPSEGLPARRRDHVMHHGFGDAGAGPARRSEHAALVEGWLRELWADADAPS